MQLGGPVAQLGERLPRTEEVSGSNPLRSTIEPRVRSAPATATPAITAAQHSSSELLTSSPQMRFEIEGAVPIDDVNPEQVEQGLRMLQLSDQTFAILDQDADSYIQTAVDGAGDGDGTFVLEYQEGSLAQH